MLVDRLRDKAREYELNCLAARERGDTAAAMVFSTIAIVLFELAETFEVELEEAA